MASRPSRRASGRPEGTAAETGVASTAAPSEASVAALSKRTASGTSARKRRRGEEAAVAPTEDEAHSALGEDEGAEGQDAPAAAASSAAPADRREQRYNGEPLASLSTPLRPTVATASSPSYDGFAPNPQLRASRLQEKTELAELNKRLELYILRQRERDALATGADREIALLRSKFLSETAQEKAHHDARYSELKKQKLDLGIALQALKDDHAKQAQLLKDSLASSNLYKLRCAELEKRMKKLEAELETVGARAIALDGEVKRQAVDLQEETEAHNLVAGQLKEQKAALALAQKQLNVVQTKFNTTLQDFEMLQSSSQEESLQLNKQVSALSKENLSIEEKLRKEFGKQLKNLLAERQGQYEEEKEEAMNKLREFYEEALKEKNESYALIQSELDAATESSNLAAKELAEERKNNQSAAAIRADYERTIASMHKSAESSRLKFEHELHRLHEHVKRDAVIITTKEKEFQTLMDVKIKLDMEIKQYNNLLDHEESRLGFQGAEGEEEGANAKSTPAKTPAAGKRKSRAGAASAAGEHSFISSEASASASRRQSSHTSSSSSGLSMSISSSSKRIVLTNSSKADESNPDAGAVDLDGLTLSTGDRKHVLELTEAAGAEKLLPGESIVVYTHGSGATHRPKPPVGSVVYEWDVAQNQVWVDGGSVQVRDGKHALHTMQIRM